MNTEKSRRYTRNVIITLIIVSLLAVVVTAKETGWFDKQLPSSELSVEQKEVLESKGITQWKSNSYWREGNCYYYDLIIGTDADETWSDPRRELFCGKTLTTDEIETLQLKHISWTLQQLSVDTVAATDPVKTKAVKGEQIKDQKVIIE